MRVKAIPSLPLCLVFLAVLVSGCGASREDSLLAANKELVRRHQEEIWNKGNTAAIDEFYTPDFVGHFPFGELVDREELKKAVAMHRAAFPDWTEQIEDIVAEGDRVAIRFISRGTQRGEFRGIKPTGRSVRIGEAALFRIVDRRIAEQWVFPDVGSLLQQLQNGSEER
jgi:steroid delta-isomerase-like uncharacterized protein